MGYNEKIKKTPASIFPPLFFVALAIMITSLMDANRRSTFSALPLVPLIAIGWYLGRYSKKETGFIVGKRSDYLLAVLYPIIGIAYIAVLAFIAGKVDLSNNDWKKNATNLLLVTLSTCVVVLITEEGFFRGYLWAALKRSGLTQKYVLIFSSVAFMIWHISAISFDTGFNLSYWQIPIFLTNALLLGLNWGLLRLISGSVVVSSICHGIWNGLVYVFFGFGQTHQGALRITAGAIFGPENGVIGIMLNVTATIYLWRRASRADMLNGAS